MSGFDVNNISFDSKAHALAQASARRDIRLAAVAQRRVAARRRLTNQTGSIQQGMLTSRQAFSFPEVLFAVIILGIGFIMIAAIFPVAISQSKMTLDETAASAVARAKVAEIQGVTYDSGTPAAGSYHLTFMPTSVMSGTTPVVTVRPIEDYALLPAPTFQAWEQVRGLELLRNDPRYATVVLYRRAGTPSIPDAPPKPLPNGWSNTAQIYLIEVTCRGTQRPKMGTIPARTSPQFDAYDFALPVSGTVPNFVNPNNISAHQIKVQTENDLAGTGPDLIKISTTAGSAADPNLWGAVAEGTYVVIGNDTNTTAPHVNVTGRIYRVGLRRTDLDSGSYQVYELQPGNDIAVNDKSEDLTSDTAAFCVGRERLPDGSFVGAAQDVSIYTTTIPVKP